LSNSPYERRTNNKQRHGLRAEKKLAKRIGGRLRPGSGAMAGAKGDISLPTTLVEVKTTTNDSISLKYEWLKKIGFEALDAGKSPALSIQFVEAGGLPRLMGKWVLVPEVVFNEWDSSRKS